MYIARLQFDNSMMDDFARQVGRDASKLTDDYRAHTLLCEAFKDMAPGAFRTGRPSGGMVPVWFYTPHDKEALCREAHTQCKPTPFSAVHWPGLNCMPVRISDGDMVKFSTVVIPANCRRDEHDAYKDYTIRAREQDVAFPRGEEARLNTYGHWVHNQMSGRGVEVITVPYIRRRRKTCCAKNGNHLKNFSRTALRVKGVLRVTDAKKAEGLFFEGIGEHQLFGCGFIVMH